MSEEEIKLEFTEINQVRKQHVFTDSPTTKIPDNAIMINVNV